MPVNAVMNIKTTMTANGTATPFAGEQFETLERDSYVEAALLADTGATVNGQLAIGSQVLLPFSLLGILAVATPFRVPDDYTLGGYGLRNQKIFAKLQEAAAGTPVVRSSARITWLR